MTPADVAPDLLPEDSEALQAMVRALRAERDREKQRVAELHLETLRLQVELERYKKWYYGPRADQSRPSHCGASRSAPAGAT